MRRTSQSMYQPANNSNLMNSKFNGALQVSSLAKSGIQPPRKLQGRDFGKTQKSSFQQTVNKLKSKPNQKVLQDEYIKGLQQQIKYLQYELKLLKDKQLLEREGVNELDNFLKDQIPINENILAMKNKYNATKNTLEQQFQLLSQKKIEATDVLTSQKNQINRLHDIIGAHRKQVSQRNKQFQQKMNQMMRQMTMTEEEYRQLSDDNKRKNQQVKKMMENIANTQRSIEKQKVMEVRAIEQKTKTTQKFQEKNKATKQNLIQSLQKLQEAKLYAENNDNKNPLVEQLEQKNSALRKKIMLNQKQKSTSQNIIAQIQLFLKEEQREREIERKQKAKHVNASEQYRNQIQNLQRFSDNMIKQQTLRYKQMLIKQMNHDLKDKQQIYDLFTDRLRNLQTQCSNLIQQKKELQDQIEQQIKLQKQKDKQTKNLTQQILQSKCKIRALQKQAVQLQKLLQPIRIQLQRIGTQSPMIQKQKAKRLKMIGYLNKKIQLMKQLKGLDLQQLHMVSVSGKMVEDRLGTFIKNWEKLKMDTQPQS